MRVGEILKSLNRTVETIDPGESVQGAIGKLVEKGIGSLLVVDEEGVTVGIITERDILRESAERSDKLSETRVRDIMTTELMTGQCEDRVTKLLGIMTQNRIRHLPIMDGTKLEGLVSIGDLVKAQVALIENENQQLKDYIQGG